MNKSKRTKTPCTCGEYALKIIGTVNFTISDKSISLTNLEHFYCSRCDKSIYDSESTVGDILKKCYIENVSEFDCKQNTI